MKKIAETERLALCEVTEDQAPFILELVNTPAWLRFIGDRGIRTTENALEYLANGPIRSYREKSVGSYCLVLKENQTPIGMCGLYERDGLHYPDLGFALLPQFEGKGYAGEAAAEIIRLVKEKTALQTLLAITSKDNERSMNLLRRLGFALERDITLPGSEEVLNCFRMDWQAKTQSGVTAANDSEPTI